MSDTEIHSSSRSITRMELFSKVEDSNTKSPSMGRLLWLLMTLDSADSLLESAVLDTVNLIKNYINNRRSTIERIAHKDTK